MQARHPNVPTNQACAGKHGDDANAAKVQVLFSLLSAGLPWSAQQPGNTQMTSLLGILLGHGMLFTVYVVDALHMGIASLCIMSHEMLAYVLHVLMCCNSLAWTSNACCTTPRREAQSDDCLMFCSKLREAFYASRCNWQTLLSCLCARVINHLFPVCSDI